MTLFIDSGGKSGKQNGNNDKNGYESFH
jgi:hypothetical protein